MIESSFDREEFIARKSVRIASLVKRRTAELRRFLVRVRKDDDFLRPTYLETGAAIELLGEQYREFVSRNNMLYTETLKNREQLRHSVEALKLTDTAAQGDDAAIAAFNDVSNRLTQWTRKQAENAIAALDYFSNGVLREFSGLTEEVLSAQDRRTVGSLLEKLLETVACLNPQIAAGSTVADIIERLLSPFNHGVDAVEDAHFNRDSAYAALNLSVLLRIANAGDDINAEGVASSVAAGFRDRLRSFDASCES